ncbi:SCP-2 sterol transfer family [Aspergillus sp. HF37]|nr:SCP-2 sterol transfer family [Aspergillus sp. HF37]
MSLKNDAFPSSAAFDVINQSLQGDEAARKEAVNQAKAVVAFTIKNGDGKEESWHLDLKENGAVGKGAAPQGGKADVTLNLSDADFASLVSGKANAQRLFMGGKLKIKGNIMKATKMEPVLKKAQGKAKL